MTTHDTEYQALHKSWNSFLTLPYLIFDPALKEITSLNNSLTPQDKFKSNLTAFSIILYMTTFCSQCIVKFENENIGIYGTVLTWSCSNVVQGVFLGSESKINKTLFITLFWHQSDVKVKHLYICYEKRRFFRLLWSHFFVQYFQNLNLAFS